MLSALLQRTPETQGDGLPKTLAKHESRQRIYSGTWEVYSNDKADDSY